MSDSYDRCTPLLDCVPKHSELNFHGKTPLHFVALALALALLAIVALLGVVSLLLGCHTQAHSAQKRSKKAGWSKYRLTS